MNQAFNILAPFNSGWILKHLAQAVADHADVETRPIIHEKGKTDEAVQEVLDRSHDVVGTIFAHHVPFYETWRRDPDRTARDVLLFGHYLEDPQHNDWPPLVDLAPVLRRATRIWTNARCWDEWLVRQGVRADQIRRLIRAVDISHFTLRSPADQRARFTVGLVSQYHYRKNERFIIDAVLRRTDVDWVLLGQRWDTTPLGLLRVLSRAPNFRYIDTRTISFDQWPAIFRSFDVFASPSLSEGGPFPLLEAMSSGVWPIASRTGFAEDVISHRRTGFVFDINDTSAFDAGLDEAMGDTDVDRAAIRAGVAPYTWARLGDAAARDLREIIAG